MTGLVAFSDTVSGPSDITNDGWFPDIAIADARDLERIGHSVSQERLRHALAGAMLSVNDELSSWKASQQLAGYASLALVPSAAISDLTRLTMLYRRAVLALAHADLLERYVDYDTTRSGADAGELKAINADEQRRNARWAISDIVGINRTTVELI